MLLVLFITCIHSAVEEGKIQLCLNYEIIASIFK